MNIILTLAAFMLSLAALIAWQSPDMLRAIAGHVLARASYIEAGQQAAEQQRRRWAAMQEHGNA